MLICQKIKLHNMNSLLSTADKPELPMALLWQNRRTFSIKLVYYIFIRKCFFCTFFNLWSKGVCQRTLGLVPYQVLFSSWVLPWDGYRSGTNKESVTGRIRAEPPNLLHHWAPHKRLFIWDTTTAQQLQPGGLYSNFSADNFSDWVWADSFCCVEKESVNEMNLE